MIIHKENGDWYLARRLYFGIWTLMAAFDTFAVFALLLVMTWNTTHNEDHTEVMLVNLWGIWCLIPGFILTSATLFACGPYGVKPLEKEWTPGS